jgi:hypothetical protein
MHFSSTLATRWCKVWRKSTRGVSICAVILSEFACLLPARHCLPACLPTACLNIFAHIECVPRYSDTAGVARCGKEYCCITALIEMNTAPFCIVTMRCVIMPNCWIKFAHVSSHLLGFLTGWTEEVTTSALTPYQGVRAEVVTSSVQPVATKQQSQFLYLV